jgi:hypothetical protein
MPDTHTILNEQIGMSRIIVTARPGRGPCRGQWLVTFERHNSKRKLLDQCAAWMPDGEWDGSRWLPFRSQFVPPEMLIKVQDWLRGRPAVAEELNPREVEAQEAFTQLRDEILSLSDGLEVNEVLYIIDNHTPEWV